MSKIPKYLTIDIGGTNIKYALINKNTKILKKGIIKSNTKENELLNSLDEIIPQYINQIEGIPISFPGVVNLKEGIACTAGSYKWVHNLPLKSILENKYNKTVWLENDGKCSALAEFYKGNLSNCKSGVTIGIGTAIAGGIILNGELYRGIDGSAAEFSYILENHNNPLTSNELFNLASYRGLINSYTKSKIDTYQFFENYHNGDKEAIKALNDYSKIIATLIINIQSILNVEKFCIGGGISGQKVLIDEIKKVVKEYFDNKAPNALKEPIIDKCYFENDAGCVGALYNFLKMENQL